MVYIIIIICSLVLISSINAILAFTGVIDQFSGWFAILATYIDFVILIGIEGLFAFVIHKMPARWFDPYRKRYIVSADAVKRYEKSKIRKWKKWVPDTGQLCDFKKDKLKNIKTDYLYKFLVETCYADTIHIWMAISGFLILLLNIRYPLAVLTIDLPIALVSLILNLPPIFLQRYNRPKLLKVYEYNLKKEEQNKE